MAGVSQDKKGNNKQKMKTKIPKFNRLFLMEDDRHKQLCLVVSVQENADTYGYGKGLEIRTEIYFATHNPDKPFEGILYYDAIGDLGTHNYFSAKTSGRRLNVGFNCTGKQCVELALAKAMAKTLAWIENETEAMRSKFGSPESYGASVARFAAIIGAECIMFQKTPEELRNSVTSRWFSVGLDTGIHRLNKIIADFQAANAPAAEVEATAG